MESCLGKSFVYFLTTVEKMIKFVYLQILLHYSPYNPLKARDERPVSDRDRWISYIKF